jgi:23S rRNA G2445 N2-methylase RlmL
MPTSAGSPPQVRAAARVVDYYVTTVGGLEEVVAADLNRRLGALSQVRAETGPRHGRVFFRYERSPRRLLELRSADNLFARVTQLGGVAAGPAGLPLLAQRLSRVDLGAALGLLATLFPAQADQGLHLVCTAGGDHRFGAAEVYEAAWRAWSPRWPLQAHTNQGGALHVQVKAGVALVGLQLTPRRPRDRDYRLTDTAGGLEATVAYCMGLLAGVRRGDRCLDPTCGTATTLIETAAQAEGTRLLGGDRAVGVLAAARCHAQAAGCRLHLAQWDAHALPLAPHSADVVLANLPFGKQVEATIDEAGLLRELARVLRPGRRAALLAGPETTLEALTAASDSGFVLRQRLRLHLRGVEPLLLVLERRTGAGPATLDRVHPRL